MSEQLVWSDANDFDPEDCMPAGYFIRADPYTICRIGSAHDMHATRTQWRFEIWRGTECLKTDCTSLTEARRWAQRHHDQHHAEPVIHDRKG